MNNTICLPASMPNGREYVVTYTRHRTDPTWHLADTGRVYRCPGTGETVTVPCDAQGDVFAALVLPDRMAWGDEDRTWFTSASSPSTLAQFARLIAEREDEIDERAAADRAVVRADYAAAVAGLREPLTEMESAADGRVVSW